MIPSSPMKTSNLTSTLNKYDDNASSTRENLVEEYPPLQYLGDLAENSPLPVSIPLKIPNNTRPGNYPVFIEISYKDNLRNGHNLIVNGTVNYTPQIGNSSNDTGLIFGFIYPIILFVMLIVIGIVLYFVIRRFRKKKKNKVIESPADYSDSENDLDSVLRDNDRSNEQK